MLLTLRENGEFVCEMGGSAGEEDGTWRGTWVRDDAVVRLDAEANHEWSLRIIDSGLEISVAPWILPLPADGHDESEEPELELVVLRRQL